MCVGVCVGGHAVSASTSRSRPAAQTDSFSTPFDRRVDILAAARRPPLPLLPKSLPLLLALLQTIFFTVCWCPVRVSGELEGVGDALIPTTPGRCVVSTSR